MIKLKPGQLCTINHVVYRAKKKNARHFLECTGCALNDYFRCPNVMFTNVDNKMRLNCETDGIILVKV